MQYYIFKASLCILLTLNSLPWLPSSASWCWYGGSFVPCSTRVHSRNKPLSNASFLPGIFSIRRVHVPWGRSAHVWVVMKGQRVKPLRWSSSFGRWLRIMDLKRDKDNSSNLYKIECTIIEVWPTNAWIIVLALKKKKTMSFQLFVFNC